MAEPEETERQSKGLNLIELVKTLRAYRRKHPLVGLSPGAEALLNERILINKWYSFEAFLEIMRLFYRLLLASNPENALNAGIVGGLASLEDAHRAFVVKGDPTASLYAMRHVWGTLFNFGELDAKVVDEKSVRFTVIDYPDVPEVHAMMIIGWDIASAQLAGAKDVTYVIEKRPWQGDPNLVYLINT